jgi:hypothetical protein
VFQVESGLEIEPESIGSSEVTSETQCCVGGDGALAVNDLVDAPRPDSYVVSQPVL